MQTFWIEHLLTPDGWRSPATVHVEDARIIAIAGDAEAEVRLEGWVLPGLPNLHSHAFQRALVGRAEHSPPDQSDSFWTWREAMYALALTVSPERLRAIAEMLYLEMLEAGMTAVGEFHYLHHQPDGTPYADRAEMSLRLLAAASNVGLEITLLPVLYQRGGFGQDPTERQRRFINDVDGFLEIVEAAKGAGARVGIAPHSLRAVEKAQLQAAMDGIGAADPIHIHVAEQTQEVDQALSHLGARPVRWLLDQMEVGPRWCLVHATHLDDAEVRDLAASGAIAGLCPTTEANLGDGIFRAVDYVAAGGRFGLGSDSHVTVDAAEELRLLEYGQRLLHQRRNLLRGPSGHVGRFLWVHGAAGGAEALAMEAGRLAVGRRADWVQLDPEHPRLAGLDPDQALDAFIFGSARAVREVWVGGQRVVENGRHHLRDQVLSRFLQD